LAQFHGGIQGSQREARIEDRPNRVADHHAREDIDDHGKKHEGALEPYVRDVSDPDLVDPGCL
jgi:hypothetical protein